MKKLITTFAVLGCLSVVPVFAAAPRCEFLANAPDKHVVVKGDTLWDIAGKFLKKPWCWPKIWQPNKKEIPNPHWIYPGQIVYFDRAAGVLRLGEPNVVKLSPRIRTSPVEVSAIPAIPAEIIGPFLSQPLVVDAGELDQTPRIAATQEDRVNLALGEKAYVVGNVSESISQYQTFRVGQALKDPQTNEVLGFEAIHTGNLKLVRLAQKPNEAHTFVASTVKQEMGVGERLVPFADVPSPTAYLPHAPEQAIDARIMTIYGGLRETGPKSVVTLNRGSNDGLEPGHVLELWRKGELIKDPTDSKKSIQIPDEKYGVVVVFRVFKRVSYALVMQANNVVKIADAAHTPE